MHEFTLMSSCPFVRSWLCCIHKSSRVPRDAGIRGIEKICGAVKQQTLITTANSAPRTFSEFFYFNKLLLCILGFRCAPEHNYMPVFLNINYLNQSYKLYKLKQSHRYSDKELIDLVAADNEPAFRELYERYYKRLLVFAFAKTDNYGDAEEIVQIVFVNLWQRRSSIKLKYSFHTYIAAITKYEILAFFASKRKQDTLKKNALNSYDLLDSATGNLLTFNQLRDEIEKTVRLLPEKCRLVFRLSREEGLTEKEICQALDIAPKTAQAHLSKALRVIRSSLNHVMQAVFL